MSHALLDLVEKGAVREAVGRADEVTDPVLRTILDGWRAMGKGESGPAVASLRPLVAALEAPDATQVHAHALLALGVASVLRGPAPTRTRRSSAG